MGFCEFFLQEIGELLDFFLFLLDAVVQVLSIAVFLHVPEVIDLNEEVLDLGLLLADAHLEDVILLSDHLHFFLQRGHPLCLLPQPRLLLLALLLEHLPLLDSQLHLGLDAEELPIVVADYLLVLLGLRQDSLQQLLLVVHVLGFLL